MPRFGQSTAPQAQLLTVAIDLSPFAQGRYLLQRFFDLMQNIPVVSALTQFEEPQWHWPLFADEPSEFSQVEYLLQLFFDLVQNSPALQLFEPQ
jgi:hypothetical protein